MANSKEDIVVVAGEKRLQHGSRYTRCAILKSFVLSQNHLFQFHAPNSIHVFL
ncbi:hypothetical protein RvY_19110, partial [Ramazzottius varieornatus]